MMSQVGERGRVDILHDDSTRTAVSDHASDTTLAAGVDPMDGEDGTDAEGAVLNVSSSAQQLQHQQQPPRVPRGRYAKFTASMDVLLLETLCANNALTAKHGKRLQKWQQVAEIVGVTLLQSPEAYTWHTCRDRVTTLMKLYVDGRNDKLFKNGTMEENTRKETLLRELFQAKSAKLLRTSPLADMSGTRTAAMASTSTASSVTGLAAAATAATVTSETPPPRGDARTHSGGKALQTIHQAAPKRRRLAGGGGEPAAVVSTRSGHLVENGAQSLVDSETFRARVLELMETKIQLDKEQRDKENELREHEMELQKRFLEYLQSK